MWTYEQSTGRLENDGTDVQMGYSGHGPGLNNPEMQNVPDVGPLPRGRYTISPPFEPAKDNAMFGRSLFRIHGDNHQMNHTASDGCIVIGYATRCHIGDAVLKGDDQLEVIE
jgi:hypothetical protein